MDDGPAPTGERGATRRLSVGFLGTGIMGAHMARRIAQAGHDLAAWNRTAAKAEALSAFGVAQACDAAAAALGADAVVCIAPAQFAMRPSSEAASLAPCVRAAFYTKGLDLCLTELSRGGLS